MDKKKLEIILSKIDSFDSPDAKKEQYATDSSIAADFLWDNSKDLKNKIIADFGCGPGVLGIGALILGAKKVFFVDSDKKVVETTRKNLKKIEKNLDVKFNARFLEIDVDEFEEKVDVVIQNPPFGVKEEHADRLFLMKAFECANEIFSFHKMSTNEFVEKIAKDNGFFVERIYRYKLPLKKTFFFHTSRIKFIDVGCWHLKRKV